MPVKMFYKMSNILFPRIKWLWFYLFFCVIFSFFGSIATHEVDERKIINYILTVSSLMGLFLFVIVLSVKTFVRLESERRCYKYHRLQEFIYTLWYSIIFSVVVFYCFYITYDFVKNYT